MSSSAGCACGSSSLEGGATRDEPGLAAERGKALSYLTVARDLLEAQSPVRQAHDVEARSPAREFELRVLRPEHRAVFDRLDELGRKERMSRA